MEKYKELIEGLVAFKSDILVTFKKRIGKEGKLYLSIDGHGSFVVHGSELSIARHFMQPAQAVDAYLKLEKEIFGDNGKL